MEGREVGDGGADESSTGDEGQAAISLASDAVNAHSPSLRFIGKGYFLLTKEVLTVLQTKSGKGENWNTKKGVSQYTDIDVPTQTVPKLSKQVFTEFYRTAYAKHWETELIYEHTLTFLRPLF